MSTDNTKNTRRAVNRRTVTTGLAWSVPAVAATAAAPFAAASLVKNPGINGWVQVTAGSSYTCTRRVTVTSRPSDPGQTPDGAPYGLYLYDTDPRGRYDAAKIVYWVRGDHTSRNKVTWGSGRNHSSCWSGPTTGTAQRKSDGAMYTPYTWTYTCAIDPSTVSEDGRLYLGDFHVYADINQNFGDWYCEPLQFWAYREIRVDADGDGPGEPELMHFERHADLDRSRGFRSGDGAAPSQAGTDRAAGGGADSAAETSFDEASAIH